MADDPIEPMAEAQPHRCEVIDLDGVRIQWGRPTTKYNEKCHHKSLVYSQEERRVWCSDCKRTIENFDAFMTFTRYFEGMERDARSKIEKADAAMTATIHRRATKAVDKAWSKLGGVAIACPHCNGGILPEDFADGIRTRYSRDYELARRNRQPKPLK